MSSEHQRLTPEQLRKRGGPAWDNAERVATSEDRDKALRRLLFDQGAMEVVTSAGESVYYYDHESRREQGLPDISDTEEGITAMDQLLRGQGRPYMPAAASASPRESAPVILTYDSRLRFAREIVKPPGQWMLALVSTVFSKRTVERVFAQLVADFREEHSEALHEQAGRTRMSFLLARHWIGFVLTVILQGAQGVAKVIKTLKGAG